MNQRGPFHVVEVYYKHGEHDYECYENTQKLMEAIMNHLEYSIKYSYGSEIEHNDPYAEERSELDDIYGEEDVNLEQLIKVVLQIGDKIRQENDGWGWAHVFEGGNKL